MEMGITRHAYSSRKLSWIAGWEVTLAAGPHKLLLKRAERKQDPALILDAIAVQPAKNMLLTK